MEPSAKRQAMRGAIAGAAMAAVARFGVALGFVYYVTHYGGQWWRPGGYEMYVMALASGLMGLVVGGAAGWTCRPVLGALIGGLLSGVSCGCFFVLPTELMIGMSHPGGYERVETAEVLCGFAAMLLAGTVAGGVGAAIGARAKGEA